MHPSTDAFCDICAPLLMAVIFLQGRVLQGCLSTYCHVLVQGRVLQGCLSTHCHVLAHTAMSDNTRPCLFIPHTRHCFILWCLIQTTPLSFSCLIHDTALSVDASYKTLSHPFDASSRTTASGTLCTTLPYLLIHHTRHCLVVWYPIYHTHTCPLIEIPCLLEPHTWHSLVCWRLI